MSVSAAIPNVRGKRPSLALPVVGIACAVLLIVTGALVMGRRDEPLPTAYGRRRGTVAGRSVNGTAVLADMFRRAGHRVITFGRFSPKLDRYDTLVWIPDSFEPPTSEQRQWLEAWLARGPQRTVIYVGRDYDAALDYFAQVLPTAPPRQADEVLRRQAEARALWEVQRSQMPADEYARWFVARRDSRPQRGENLSGPWSNDIDAKAANLFVEGVLATPTEANRTKAQDAAPLPTFKTLLAADGAPLVARLTDPSWNDGQIIVVANGSFLLNFPLVNHEHRKLASRLIGECHDSGNVVFVESGDKGPSILAKEPTGGLPTGLELLKVWPLNVILWHLTILGMVLCLSKALIFGRPRELAAESSADFGQHVSALGKLLARTKDRNYAQARLGQYRQLAQRRSGRSHRKTGA